MSSAVQWRPPLLALSSLGPAAKKSRGVNAGERDLINVHSLLISSKKFDKGMFFVATERGLQLLLTACKDRANDLCDRKCLRNTNRKVEIQMQIEIQIKVAVEGFDSSGADSCGCKAAD